MYRFSSKASAPIAFDIDGTTYRLPRFLGPQFSQWTEDYRQKQIDAHTEGMTPRERAQFLAFTPPVPVSVSEVWRALLSPDGVRYVMTWALAEASVPDKVAEAVLDGADPRDLEAMVAHLTSADEIAAEVDADAVEADSTVGDGADFLHSTSGSTTATSGASPATGTPTTPDSASPTPASTPTA